MVCAVLIGGEGAELPIFAKADVKQWLDAGNKK